MINNKDTKTTSDAFTVNFEHILHIFLLLILLDSNKYMPFGNEKW